jgi:hypothetical protein
LVCDICCKIYSNCSDSSIWMMFLNLQISLYVVHMGYIQWKTEINCTKVKGMICYLVDIFFRLLAKAKISCIFLCQGHTDLRHCIWRLNDLVQWKKWWQSFYVDCTVGILSLVPCWLCCSKQWLLCT